MNGTPKFLFTLNIIAFYGPHDPNSVGSKMICHFTEGGSGVIFAKKEYFFF